MTFPDFEEFIALLNAHHVRYLIVGGYAVGFHARPRATKDIDVLIDSSAANARRARTALLEFLGVDAPNITEAKLRHPRTLVARRRPRANRRPHQRGGDSVLCARVEATCRGNVRSDEGEFASLEDLIASKSAAGRLQDLADLDVLRRAAARRKRARR